MSGIENGENPFIPSFYSALYIKMVYFIGNDW